MNINELQPRQGKVDITVEVVSIESPREFNKFGKSGRVANALVKDETGQVKMTLWNDDIDKVKPGMKIHIENGYVNEWQGEMQLTTGRFGKMEIIENASAPEEKQELSSEQNHEPVDAEEKTQKTSNEEVQVEEEVI